MAKASKAAKAASTIKVKMIGSVIGCTEDQGARPRQRPRQDGGPRGEGAEEPERLLAEAGLRGRPDAPPPAGAEARLQQLPLPEGVRLRQPRAPRGVRGGHDRGPPGPPPARRRPEGRA